MKYYLINDSHNSMGNDHTYAKVIARRPPNKSIQHSNVPNKGVIIEESIMINDEEIANQDPVPPKLTQQDNVSWMGLTELNESVKVQKNSLYLELLTVSVLRIY